MQQLSRNSTGTGHPSVWSLVKAESSEGLPKIVKDGSGHIILDVKIPTSSGDLAIGLVLIGKADGARQFIIRYFRVEPGGWTALENHPHDHGIFILHGRARVLLGKEEVEVGPRDGLQNESAFVPTADKIAFVNRLSEAGHAMIEVSAFVSPKWVPQMADAADVFAGITRRGGVRYTALVPNLQGLARARDARVDEVAVFPAASETFSKRNLNQTIDEALARMDAGTYGACVECGELIERARLEARPHSLLCLNCQRARERVR